MKIYIFGAMIFAILIWVVYREGWNKCEQENLAKQSQEQVKIKDNVIKNKGNQKTILLKPSMPSDRLEWLQNINAERSEK